MKNTFRTKIFAAILAAVCAVSVVSATVIGVSASSFSSAVAAQVKGQPCEIAIKGEDWNYSAASLNAIITCDYDYVHHICRFKATGYTPGVTKAVLKVQRTDGQWDNIPVVFTVDEQLNVTCTGAEAYTEQTTPTEPVQTSEPEQKPAPETPVESGKVGTFTLKGEDWNYYAASLNVKITCDYDYATGTCRFIGTGVKPGVTDAVLKVQRTDGRWDNVPVRFTADKNLDVTVQHTGKVYITAHSYTE